LWKSTNNQKEFAELNSLAFSLYIEIML